MVLNTLKDLVVQGILCRGAISSATKPGGKNTMRLIESQGLCGNSKSICSVSCLTIKYTVCQSSHAFIHYHLVANICLLDWLCFGASSPVGDALKSYWADLLQICSPKTLRGKIPIEGFVGSAVITDCVCTSELYIQEKR